MLLFLTDCTLCKINWVAYEGGVGPWGYDLGELRQWLNAWRGQS